tara:strand:- start:1120 stop:1650 length:531 start_codon:yes stop_codon:yes gene_type:complete
MILLKSNYEFFLKSIFVLILQKKLPVTLEKSDKHFFKIEILFENNYLKIVSSLKSSSLKIPIPFELILAEIKNHFANKFIKLGNYNYSPINQSISYNKKILYLNYIHNIILNNLILYKNIGVDKNHLYKMIWTHDKDIQINKLDTHITNLKNKTKKELNIDLKIITNSGILRLSID